MVWLLTEWPLLFVGVKLGRGTFSVSANIRRRIGDAVSEGHVELGHIRSSVPLRQLHIYTLAPRVPLISDPLPESTHGQPR